MSHVFLKNIFLTNGMCVGKYFSAMFCKIYLSTIALKTWEWLIFKNADNM